MGDERLKLDIPLRSKRDRLMQWAHGGFEVRPLGFAIGVTLSQWFVQGFTLVDFFSTTGILCMLAAPLQILALWFLLGRAKTKVMKVLCVIIIFAICCFEVDEIIPYMSQITSFAVLQMFQHQVMAYLAIPVDMLVVF